MVINTQKNTHDQRLVMTLLIKYPLWAVYQLVVMTQLINFVGACNDHHIFFFPRNTCASDCCYFVSSYPTHQIGSALPFPKPWQ